MTSIRVSVSNVYPLSFFIGLPYVVYLTESRALDIYDLVTLSLKISSMNSSGLKCSISYLISIMVTS